jgi:hypothetical protein
MPTKDFNVKKELRLVLAQDGTLHILGVAEPLPSGYKLSTTVELSTDYRFSLDSYGKAGVRELATTMTSKAAAPAPAPTVRPTQAPTVAPTPAPTAPPAPPASLLPALAAWAPINEQSAGVFAFAGPYLKLGPGEGGGHAIVALKPGQTYKFSGTARADWVQDTMRIGVRVFDANWVMLKDEYQLVNATDDALFSVAVTAPANAGHAYLYAWKGASGSWGYVQPLSLLVTAAVQAPAPTVAPPQTAPGLGYPFGSRLQRYVGGTIKPNQTDSAMDTVLVNGYNAWKAAAVKPVPSVPGGLAVRFSDPNYLCVSEGIGYGMLLAVLFAGVDPKARETFDGLLTTVDARWAYAVKQYVPQGRYLMEWRLNADGTSGGEGWNAVDGDLDIAMALIMAHKQWGSGGWNYLQLAKNVINEMKAYNFRADGTSMGLAKGHVSRTSDYMLGHFRSFARVTGDSWWIAHAIPRAQFLADLMQTKHSGVGLMPDFIVYTDTAAPQPSPGNMGDGNLNEHHYWWNACRNPWRLASDYLTSGDTMTKAITTRLIDFFAAKGAANPYAIGTGYRISDGQQITGGNSPAYHGPILAGACVDAKYQAFCNAMWEWNATHMTTGYYDGEIQLLSMVVASGNWWQP